MGARIGLGTFFWINDQSRNTLVIFATDTLPPNVTFSRSSAFPSAVQQSGLLILSNP
jgi:hypothetical protein